MRSRTFAMLFAWFMAFATVAHGMSSNPNVTKNEWRLLPPGCMYVEFAPEFQSETARRLRAADSTWRSMHHYCWAIVQTMRTYHYTVDQQLARAYMRSAISNLDYSIHASKPGFVLRPDMFVRKAALQARLGRFFQAAETAQQLIAESPELPEGYIALADVQLKAGRPDQARETLERASEKVGDKTRFETMKKQLSLR